MCVVARWTVAVLGLRILWKLRDVVEESLYVVPDKRVRIVWRTFGYASLHRLAFLVVLVTSA